MKYYCSVSNAVDPDFQTPSIFIRWERWMSDFFKNAIFLDMRAKMTPVENLVSGKVRGSRTAIHLPSRTTWHFLLSVWFLFKSSITHFYWRYWETLLIFNITFLKLFVYMYLFICTIALFDTCAEPPFFPFEPLLFIHFLLFNKQFVPWKDFFYL